MRARKPRLLTLPVVVSAALVFAGGCGSQEAETPSASASPEATPTDGDRPAGPASTPAGKTPVASYPNAPEFELDKIEGGVLASSSLRGKVVLLDFWATWCGPCRVAIPHLNALYAAHKENGFEIVGISLDQGRAGKSGAETVRAFARGTRMDYPLVMGDQATVRAFGGVRAIPTAFLVDREGRIRNRFVGLQPKHVIENAVKELLEESADADGPI